MLRVLFREAVVVVLSLLVASAATFAVLDALGRFDWYGTEAAGARIGLRADEAGFRNVPRFFHPTVRDSVRRIDADLDLLARADTRPAAHARLVARGGVILPVVLARLGQLQPEPRNAALAVLASLPAATRDHATPPSDPTRALAFWDRYRLLHGLDFREPFCRRLVQRLVQSGSRNAEESLLRVDTYALPAIFGALEEPVDDAAARRLTQVASMITHAAPPIPADASVTDVRDAVESWRAWWFVRSLEYESLAGWRRVFAQVTETRYGRWLWCASTGRLGPTRTTHVRVLPEFRARVRISLLFAGLSGLLATALVVAFGGSQAMRSRPLGTKLLDLAGALVPGAAAGAAAYALILTMLRWGPPLPSLSDQLRAHTVRMVLASAALVPVAAALLSRPGLRGLLDAVRVEAEAWALESRDPHFRQIIRHGARVGLASMLVPPGLVAAPLVVATVVLEPLFGVEGLGQLTFQSLVQGDGPWLMLVGLSLVPLGMGRRWALRLLYWALTEPAADRR